MSSEKETGCVILFFVVLDVLLLAVSWELLSCR